MPDVKPGATIAISFLCADTVIQLSRADGPSAGALRAISTPRTVPLECFRHPEGRDVYKRQVYIRLTGASTAGTMKGKSELHLELVKMDFQGRSYSLVSGTYSLAGKSRGQDTAKKVGGGAVIGTIIGAIAGGGKGAAIGACLLYTSRCV